MNTIPPSKTLTTLSLTLTAAGLFSLLIGVLETVRVYAIDSVVDTGLAKLGLSAMIVGGLTTAAVGLGTFLSRTPRSLPKTVAVIAGWLIIWFPLTVALGIATDRFPWSQLMVTALCIIGIFAAVAAFVRSDRRVSGARNTAE